jgi:hypothetical protein
MSTFGLGQRLRGGQAAETGADDDDFLAIWGLHGAQFMPSRRQKNGGGWRSHHFPDGAQQICAAFALASRGEGFTARTVRSSV